MPKKQTVRFYTASGRYTGWQYLSETTYFNIIDWIKAKNYLLLGDRQYDSHTTNNEIFALIRQGKKEK